MSREEKQNSEEEQRRGEATMWRSGAVDHVEELVSVQWENRMCSAASIRLVKSVQRWTALQQRTSGSGSSDGMDGCVRRRRRWF